MPAADAALATPSKTRRLGYAADPPRLAIDALPAPRASTEKEGDSRRVNAPFNLVIQGRR
jgi:hypothetical protein